MHIGERLYSCDICDRAFVMKGELNKHSKTHMAEFNEEQETSNQSKDNHQKRNSTSDKLYSCNLCYFSFKRKSDLQQHSLQHSKERPFSCTLCDKSFVYQNTLNNHLRMHRGENAYKCCLCEVSFSQSSALCNHMKAHKG